MRATVTVESKKLKVLTIGDLQFQLIGVVEPMSRKRKGYLLKPIGKAADILEV